jgi:hypothetical protein
VLNFSGIFVSIVILYKSYAVINQYKLYRNKITVVYSEVLKNLNTSLLL